LKKQEEAEKKSKPDESCVTKKVNLIFLFSKYFLFSQQPKLTIMQIELTEQGSLTLDFINQTERHVFLTGKAGTGKTTLLRQILEQTHKHVVVVAPTGIAALNAGGVTIHSMFQVPFDSFLPQDYWGASNRNQFFETPRTLRNHTRMGRDKKRVIRQMDVLIIDEVSMLRADLLDALELTMRRVRGNNQSFGGVQVLFIGDLMQLPPVVKPEEWEVLSKFYKSSYFFHATCLEKNPPLYIELKKIFRQEDPVFIDLLNRLRNNNLTDKDALLLQKYFQPNFKLSEHPGVIMLTTHNYKAARVNDSNLKALKTPSLHYYAEIQGDFPDKIYPVDAKMELKVGAQVMFTRNDTLSAKRFYNGKIGTVEFLDGETIKVRTNDDNQLIVVEPQEWENVQYNINEQTKVVQQKIIGTFVQYPLRLAWAITIHKSQGLTFSNAALDVEDIFQAGQAYVAFSRLRSIEGLVLLSQLQINKFRADGHVLDYTSQEMNDALVQKELANASQSYIAKLLKSSFDISGVFGEWMKHQQSYFEAKDNAVKAEFQGWALGMGEHIKPLVEISENFARYVDKNFHPENLEQVIQKTRNARDYFIKQLEKFAEALIVQLAHLNKKKKVKTYFNELYDFEEMFLSFIQRMENCVVMAETYVAGGKVDKSLFDPNYIRRFRERMMDRAKSNITQQSKEKLIPIASEDLTIEYKTTKKEPKEKKIPTAEISYNMFIEGKSVEEIATERMFAKSTIEGHLAQMVKEGKLDANKIVTLEKMLAIEKVLNENPDWEGLKPYKELLGEEFSFGEIKVVLAHREREIEDKV